MRLVKKKPIGYNKGVTSTLVHFSVRFLQDFEVQSVATSYNRLEYAIVGSSNRLHLKRL
jgi:hypothetical protein